MLDAAAVPHPRTGVVRSPSEPLTVSPPLVIKPRFGSWGIDVHRCESERHARETLRLLGERTWFRLHGALIQELVGPRPLRPAADRRGRAGGRGRPADGGARGVADERLARRERSPAVPDDRACELACVGPRSGAPLRSRRRRPRSAPPGGDYVVLELNGAVDFDAAYSLPGGMSSSTSHASAAWSGCRDDPEPPALITGMTPSGERVPARP